MAAKERILGRFRYRGVAYGPGDEEKFEKAVEQAGKDEAEPDMDRLREAGAIGEPEDGQVLTARRVQGATGQSADQKAGAVQARRGGTAKGSKGGSKPAAGEGEGTGTGSTHPTTVEDLPEHLQGINDADEVRRQMDADDRVTAKPLYEARLAELEQK